MAENSWYEEITSLSPYVYDTCMDFNNIVAICRKMSTVRLTFNYSVITQCCSLTAVFIADRLQCCCCCWRWLWCVWVWCHCFVDSMWLDLASTAMNVRAVITPLILVTMSQRSLIRRTDRQTVVVASVLARWSHWHRELIKRPWRTTIELTAVSVAWPATDQQHADDDD